MQQLKIDINCDMGESYGNFRVGNDAELMPLVSSCSIACGFHGGDPYHIERTISLALEYGVRIGAHPSYPDLAGFGRRPMKIAHDELSALIRYQVGAVKSMVESLGGRLAFVKPHGALYNSIVTDREEAIAVVSAVRSIDENLKFMGLAGSGLEALAEDIGIGFLAEAFADRMYTSDGRLVSRAVEGAVINDPAVAAEQVLNIVRNKQLMTMDGEIIHLRTDTICVHGDTSRAVDVLKALHKELAKHNISVSSA